MTHDTMIIKGRIIFEHGPGSGGIHSTSPTTETVIVPVLSEDVPFPVLMFENHYYRRTPRNSGAPEFRQIYTWRYMTQLHRYLEVSDETE